MNYKTTVGYAPLVLGLLLIPTLPILRGWYFLYALLVFLVSWWLVLRDTLNLVQGIGKVYWLTRSTEVFTFRVQLSFMRETDYPWRSGKGLQLVFPYRTFQIGICKPSKHYTVDEGLLHSLVARKLPSKPEDIREW